jgi:hypothetical protein
MLADLTVVRRWLHRRPAYLLLTGSPEDLESESPERFTKAWRGVLGWSLTWGVAMVALYQFAWATFWELPGLHLMPVATVVAATVMWPYRRAVVALARATGGDSADQAGVCAGAIVVGLALALLGLPSWRPHWTSIPWLLRLMPRTMFWVLLLAPLWGGWVMLILPKFYRPSPATEPQVAAMIHGCGAPAAALTMAIPLAPTLWIFSVFGWWHLTIPVATLIGALAGGWVLCRRFGGPTRQALLATNLLSQLVFILAYVALIR